MANAKPKSRGAAPFEVVGASGLVGSYLLRIDLARRHEVRFGRFKGGKEIGLAAGQYLYIGSALGRGAALARRLLRHGTRTPPRPPHPIRADMLAYFQSIGLADEGLAPPQGKKLFWNIDHLLDLEAARLRQVFLLRTAKRLEAQLGQLLAADAATVAFASGLGANDVPGMTHLLRVDAGAVWWQQLPAKLRPLLPEDCPV